MARLSVTRLSVRGVAVLAWLFLVGATLVTYRLVEGHRFGPEAALSMVMLIAAAKGRMIVLHYMELKHAPRHWRVAFELWVVLASSLILGLWFFMGTPADCSSS